MAILRPPFPKEPEEPSAALAMKYDDLLKRSHRQAALATEMSNKARQMIDHALEMRERPVRFVVP